MLPASCLLLCLGLAAASTVTITDFEVPKTVKAGESAELRCRYSMQEAESALFYVKWWWTPVNGTKTQVYQRLGHHAPQSRHEGLVIKPDDSIELVELQPDDSGVYECEVSNIDEARRSQELVVYTRGIGPLLNLTIADSDSDDGEEAVLVTCEAFEVAPEPELVISVESKSIDAENVTVTGPVDGRYDLAVSAALPQLEDGALVRCELYYKNPAIKHEPYEDSVTYESSGAEEDTAAPPEVTTEWETTTPQPGNGSVSTIWSHSCLLLAVIATLGQFVVAL